ncbi:MAG: decarboxylating 6-phosphogluconate dehydrogenase [Candidatus Dormibacteraeota bacterium]|nr:decarboxylating 6-phosphogluconate dehydrogenase [Candidatus Dormibacteraeota bacterium]
MEMAMIGLGRMGGNMVSRLLKAGHRMIAYDQSAKAVEAKVGEGAVGAASLQELPGKFSEKPRVVWVMVPAGDPTTKTIAQLGNVLEPGDIVIDGGNTNWQLAMKDAGGLKAKGIHYLDAGTSGGVWGLKNGYGLMVGGEDAVFEHCKPLLSALAPAEGGLVHCGPEGSGHFVKMVHNGIEYGLMQAYGEGFEILKKSKAFPGMDLQAIADAWRYGTVVRSWLLDLIAIGLKEDPELATLTAYIEDTGEGRWTVQAAIDEDVPAFTITHSLFERFRSRDPNSFSDRVVAMMRKQFGGHAVRPAGHG